MRVAIPLPDPSEPQRPAPDQQTAGALPPLLYDTADMCAVLRIGMATLHRLKSSSKLPRARKLAGLKWDVDEVRRWVAAGMPALKEWEAMEAARLKRTN